MAETKKNKIVGGPNHLPTKLPTLQIHNCPQSLINRANAKAALKGKGISEWVVQVLERETSKLKPLEDEYNAEPEH